MKSPTAALLAIAAVALRSRPWVIFKGGIHLHARRKGPGRRHKKIQPGPEKLLTTAERKASWNRSAPDAGRRPW